MSKEILNIKFSKKMLDINSIFKDVLISSDKSKGNLIVHPYYDDYDDYDDYNGNGICYDDMEYYNALSILKKVKSNKRLKNKKKNRETRVNYRITERKSYSKSHNKLKSNKGSKKYSNSFDELFNISIKYYRNIIDDEFIEFHNFNEFETYMLNLGITIDDSILNDIIEYGGNVYCCLNENKDINGKAELIFDVTYGGLWYKCNEIYDEVN